MPNEYVPVLESPTDVSARYRWSNRLLEGAAVERCGTMRTTLRIDDNLMQQAKRIAADSGRTLTAVIEDALREAFVRRAESQSKRKVELPTFGSGGLMPGVDINDSASLLDVMEADDDPV